MLFVDTHTHLFTDAFDTDRKEMIDRALRSGVKQMLLPNIDLDSIEPLKALAKEYPRSCQPMMGLHPSSVGPSWKEDLDKMYEELSTGNYIAVGETGMDLYWDKTYQKEQEQAFRIQIQWAKEFNLPIVIHAREAFNELFAILDDIDTSTLKGVFHCFTGSVEQAKKIISYGGFYLGIGGVLTYKKSELTSVIEEIDCKHLILETDSPYLPPVPFRGKRNESSYLVYVAEKLAEVKKLPLSEIAAITTYNAHQLFQLNNHVE